MAANFFCNILFFSMLFVVAFNSPLNKKILDEKDINEVIKYWKDTRDNEESQRFSKPVPVADLVCNLDQAIIDEIHSYQSAVNQIIELFTTGSFKGQTYDLLAYITDTFGPRLTGSSTLDNAIDWVVQRSISEGFDNVYTENFTATHWVRNNESLFMLSPRWRELSILGLGKSIATAPEGITGQILVVSSFDELTALADLAVGNIVVYDVPFTDYGTTVAYRSRGAVEAARVGAIAALVRSVTPFSINSPHTGDSNYDVDVPKIPFAAVTVEDATMLHRMQDRGDSVTLLLTMGAENFPDVSTRNTVIELQGNDKPEEVVVVSGHLDSWDVGAGTMDDAGGCTISWMVGMALKNLSLTPSRTLRTIMFSAEEQGIFGGEAYFTAHAVDSANFQLMMESDFGTFYPRGIGFSGTDEGLCMMQEILSLTILLGTTTLQTQADTPDLGPFAAVGVPRGSLVSDSDNYFWYHHSNGDRMEVNDRDTLDRVAALWASVAYVSADVSFRFPQIPNRFRSL